MPDVPLPDLDSCDFITRTAFRLRARMQQHLANISERMIPLSELGAGMSVKQRIEEGWQYNPEKEELTVVAVVVVKVGRSDPSPAEQEPT